MGVTERTRACGFIRIDRVTCGGGGGGYLVRNLYNRLKTSSYMCVCVCVCNERLSLCVGRRLGGGEGKECSRGGGTSFCGRRLMKSIKTSARAQRWTHGESFGLLVRLLFRRRAMELQGICVY